MKRLVVNKYEKVLVVIGFSISTMSMVDIYPSVQAALDGISRLYKSTIYEEKPQTIQIYGIITEDNGYQHEDNKVLFETSTREFWGGKKPRITEILESEQKKLKELICIFGVRNNWKGYIGLYLTTKQLQRLKKYVPLYEEMSIKSIYESL